MFTQVCIQRSWWNKRLTWKISSGMASTHL